MNRTLAGSAAGLLLLVGLTGCSLDTASAGDGGGVTDTSGQASTDDSGTTTDTSGDTSTDDSSVPAEYKAALEKAQEYSDQQHMSKAGLLDQLTSSYGEGFTKDAAQYAVDNVDADWDANALAKAQEYRDQQSMSSAAIHDQLTSSYGEGFTEEQADYAVANLDG